MPESCVGQRVVRVLCDRLIEVVDRFSYPLRRPFVPEKAALEIKLIGLGVIGRARSEGALFRAGEFCL